MGQVLLHRVLRFPNDAIQAIDRPLARCISENFGTIYKSDSELAWRFFDVVLAGILTDDSSATSDLVSETTLLWDSVESSRRTIDCAINDVVGMMAEGWLDALESLKLPRYGKIPEAFKTRVTRLLTASKEGRDHAITCLSRQTNRLYCIDPDWVLKNIAPRFNFEHPDAEPAWNGYLHGGQLPPPGLRGEMKEFLLDLFPRIYQWRWDDHPATVAVRIIVVLAVSQKDQTDGISKEDARTCLKEMRTSNLQDALSRLAIIGKLEENGWREHVIPFIRRSWPQNQKFRTGEMTSAWVDFLSSTGDSFPEVLECALPLLGSIEQEVYWLYPLTREDDGTEPLPKQYPDEVLELLDAIIPEATELAPYKLEVVLDHIKLASPDLEGDDRFKCLKDLVKRQ